MSIDYAFMFKQLADTQRVVNHRIASLEKGQEALAKALRLHAAAYKGILTMGDRIELLTKVLIDAGILSPEEWNEEGRGETEGQCGHR